MSTYFKHFLNDQESALLVECCECGNVHRKGNRIERQSSPFTYRFCCPQCGEESYFSLEKENDNLKELMKFIPIHETNIEGDVLYIKSDVEEAIFNLLRDLR